MSGALVGMGMATTAGTGVTLLGPISEINPPFFHILQKCYVHDPYPPWEHAQPSAAGHSIFHPLLRFILSRKNRANYSNLHSITHRPPVTSACPGRTQNLAVSEFMSDLAV